MLYLNGAYVGRGPARSDPRFKTYDTYDVAAALRPGRNVIAVRAYHYGSPAQGSGWGSTSGNGYTAGERAGLWAQVEVTDAGGARQVSGTGPDWRLLPSPAWNTNTPMVNSGLVGSNEIYDASVDVPNWTGVDFDDGEWTRPVAGPAPRSTVAPAGSPRHPTAARDRAAARPRVADRRADRHGERAAERHPPGDSRGAALPAGARDRRECRRASKRRTRVGPFPRRIRTGQGHSRALRRGSTSGARCLAIRGCGWKPRRAPFWT